MIGRVGERKLYETHRNKPPRTNTSRFSSFLCHYQQFGISHRLLFRRGIKAGKGNRYTPQRVMASAFAAPRYEQADSTRRSLSLTPISLTMFPPKEESQRKCWSTRHPRGIILATSGCVVSNYSCSRGNLLVILHGGMAFKFCASGGSILGVGKWDRRFCSTRCGVLFIRSTPSRTACSKSGRGTFPTSSPSFLFYPSPNKFLVLGMTVVL